MISNGTKIPWWQPQTEKEELDYLKQALKANFVNEGPLTEKFENEIKQITGAKYALATTNCTSAMFLSLKALGIGHGDEVIVPDITFIATANAVSLAGATPVLVDVEPERLTIDLKAAERAINKKTKAIIPVHITGRAAQIEGVLALAKKHSLAVVEDSAEAIGSFHKGQHLGTFGNAGCFSFAANKTIATGQGGMIVTNDEALYRKLRPLKDQGRPVRGTGGNDIHDTIGFNFRFTDVQAALGLGQLAHFKERTDRMRRNYELYKKSLKGVEGIRVIETDTVGGELPQWTDVVAEKRDELEAHLRSQNIDCRKYWLPLHQQKAYPLPDTNFPNSTKLSPQSLWLPSAFTLTDLDISTVSSSIKKFYGK